MTLAGFLLSWYGFYDMIIMWSKLPHVIHRRSDFMEFVEEFGMCVFIKFNLILIRAIIFRNIS